jgi:hypothetical protein
LSLLAGLLLTATALLAAALPWLLPWLAGLLSATALLATLTALLAGFVVRVHNCSLVYLLSRSNKLSHAAHDRGRLR